MLEKEIACFNKNLPQWLKDSKGRIVLIKEEELIGTFDTIEDATSEGVRRFGLQPFLVRRVEERQDEINIPSLSLGILRANTS